MSSAFVAGLLLGGFVAAQVGPVSLLCIRTSTRSGFRVGVSVGLGAAVVDLLYAICGVAGAAAIVQIEPVRLTLGLVGAAVLAFMAIRTLRTAWRLRLGGETSQEVAVPSSAFRTGVVATASNPLTIISWAAIFGAANAGAVADTAPDTLALLLGIGIGSAGWFVDSGDPFQGHAHCFQGLRVHRCYSFRGKSVRGGEAGCKELWARVAEGGGPGVGCGHETQSK